MSQTEHEAASTARPFDPKSVKKLSFLDIVKRVGHGLILTGVVIGPGNITTSAMLGADYGYSMVWLVIPIAFMGITFMLATYRISMLCGMPMIDAIRHYYGNVAAGFVGLATFLSCFFFTMGNVTGIGAGMNLLFNIDWKLGAIIMLAVLAWCYFTKGVYSKVEKGITLCILAMIVAFYAALIRAGGPDWGELGYGMTHWTIAEGSLATALACVICFSYGGSPTQLIYIANVLAAISTPVGGLFICLLLGRKDVSGDVPVSRPLQVCMIISYIFCVVMTISALATNLPKMLSSFGL